MRIIDAHQHFWEFDPVRDNWITDDMAVIRRDFRPSDLRPVLEKNGVEGCITVQSDQSETENEFQLHNAAENDFIQGIVGWVDLESDDIEEQIGKLSSHKKMKGFRHILQGEVQRDFMLRPAFKRGIGCLNKFGFTYDILIFPDQLKYTEQFVRLFPNQRFIIDHLAKPDIKDRQAKEWEKDIRAVAKHENVFCKVSGMVTEADWKNWKQTDFSPYLDVVTEAFGSNRLVFGSDWPACLPAASYEQVLGIVRDYYSSFSNSEQQSIFATNAIRFYNLG